MDRRDVKIVFLDFDGVIRTERSKLAGYDIDPVSVGLVNKLCKATNAKLVISSSWRIDYSLRSYLQYLGIDEAHVFPRNYLWGTGLLTTEEQSEIWRTPPFNPTDGDYHSEEFSRGHQIQMWLDNYKHVFNVTHYVILDDDRDILPEQERCYVHIHDCDGITTADYNKALKLLWSME